jgi:hypothetical protein
MQGSDLPWDQIIDYALFAYRTSQHSSTGYTPSYLLYGRELHMPLEVIIGIPNEEKALAPANYAQQIKDNIIQASAKARQHLQTSQRRMKKRFDEKTHLIPIAVGDIIFVRNKLSTALMPRFKGPYRVLKNMHDKVLEVIPTDNSTGTKTITVSIDNVKKAHPELIKQIEFEKRRSLLNEPPTVQSESEESTSSSEEDELIFQNPIPRIPRRPRNIENRIQNEHQDEPINHEPQQIILADNNDNINDPQPNNLINEPQNPQPRYPRRHRVAPNRLNLNQVQQKHFTGVNTSHYHKQELQNKFIQQMDKILDRIF